MSGVHDWTNLEQWRTLILAMAENALDGEGNVESLVIGFMRSSHR
jgi:hypothetical protein